MSMRLSRDKIIILSYFSGVILAGAALLMLPISWMGPTPLHYIDALFTATSAVCVTGLITVDTALYSIFGQAVIAALIQAGGLGIITFATIYVAIPRKKISLVNRRMIKDFYIDEVEYNPRKIIESILLVTLAVEGLGFLLLYSRFGRLKDGAFIALFHSISAFCNAGFSTFSTNLEGYVGDPLVNITIMLLIIAGGLGFIVFRDLAKTILGHKRYLATHSRIALGMTAVLVVGGAALYFFLESRHSLKGLPFGTRILASFFMSVTPRTAGFDTVAPARLSDASTLLTMFLMFVGASPGSTGGGVKTTTLFVLVMATLRGTDEKGRLAIGRRSISPQAVIKAISIVGKGLLIVFSSTILILLIERPMVATGAIGLVEVLYEVISAFGTVGLSLGITPGLFSASKLVLIATMFAGRIGLFTMSLPAREERIERDVGLPETDVMVG